MKLSIHKLSIFLMFIFCCINNYLFAQRDTSKKQTIEISSSFKPVLKSATKINFSASQLPSDTSILKLNYTIPAFNLFYSYQPIPLKPLALQQDTSLKLGVRNFVKVGLGNYRTPYLNAGFSFGDGKDKLFGLYTNYISSKGKIVNQDYSLFSVKGSGSFFKENNQINIGLGFSQNNYSLYGYDHTKYNFSKAEAQQKYQDLQFNAGIQNTSENEMGINYNPYLQADIFINKNKLSENTLLIIAPIEKKTSDFFSVSLEARADMTSYSSKGLLPADVKFNNNVFQLSPAMHYSTNRFKVNAGVIPTWDNNKFSLLPNIYGEVPLKEKVFSLQAGMVGKYTKNTFKNLSAINPYIQTLGSQVNTQEIELFGGIKTSIGTHFTLNAKAGFITYDNFALFVNDTATDDKSFKIAYETKADNVRIHADVSYINQELFTLTAGLTLNGYSGFGENDKAWNTIPVEFTSSLRWWMNRQILLKGDFYMFGGSNYFQKGNVTKKLGGGTDLSLGGEYVLNKKVSLWTDFNNIFSNKYQRWPNYPVYGLNVLAGVRVVF